jgi:hypothetical protein
MKAAKEVQDSTPGTAASPQAQNQSKPNQASTSTGGGFPMKVGSSGDLVKVLQRKLNSKYNSGLTVDGSFGPATAAALNSAAGKSEISTRDSFNSFIMFGRLDTSSSGSSSTGSNNVPITIMNR